MVPLAHMSLHHEQHFNRFTDHPYAQHMQMHRHTDTQTDHATCIRRSNRLCNTSRRCGL